MLAEKALLPLIPSIEEFPYTIRATSEIVSSNGSTSMAALSAATLALMDAGVPIKAPASGISMGLMSKGWDNYIILTDIQGPEDHHGDMDFKVAGTREGVNAIQMDVKLMALRKNDGGNFRTREKARYQLLDTIEATLPKPRLELSPYAPRIIIYISIRIKFVKLLDPAGK